MKNINLAEILLTFSIVLEVFSAYTIAGTRSITLRRPYQYQSETTFSWPTHDPPLLEV